MISIEDDNEYSVLIADLIKTIGNTSKYILKIWLRGTDLSFNYSDEWDYHFMQEGVRIMNHEQIDWIFYDEIAFVRVYYESN